MRWYRGDTKRASVADALKKWNLRFRLASERSNNKNSHSFKQNDSDQLLVSEMGDLTNQTCKGVSCGKMNIIVKLKHKNLVH